MTVDGPELEGLRRRVGWLVSEHIRLIRVSGGGAFDALDALLPIPLYLQEAELRATLLLDERGRPWADAVVGREGDDLLLHVEALHPSTVGARLSAALPGAVVTDLSAELACLSIHGPWAW